MQLNIQISKNVIVQEDTIFIRTNANITEYIFWKRPKHTCAPWRQAINITGMYRIHLCILIIWLSQLLLNTIGLFPKVHSVTQTAQTEGTIIGP
jgi:hypothetical protein